MTKTFFQRSRTIFAAIAAAGAIAAAHAQTTTNLLSETTFDPEAPAAWGYGYFYGNNGLGDQLHTTSYYLPDDVDQTNGMWHYAFDLTDLAGTTGYGTGTGGPLFRTDPDPASFISTNRDDYVFSFDALVEGLAPGQTQANAEMQLQLFYRDENNAEVKSLQVNLPFQPTAQWQRFTFNLGQGALGDNTADSEFALHAAQTSDIRFNVNFHEPHLQFEYDAENALFLDNARLIVIDQNREPEQPKFGVPVVDWNFDDKTIQFQYQYQWSQNSLQPVVTAGANVNGNDPNQLGRDESSGWFLTVDTSEFINDPPQWAGAGTGGGGPVDYTLFDTGDPASYRVTFDARVSGLAEGRTFTGAALQLHLDAPDDTIDPADEDGAADFIARFDFPIARVGPEWQTYSILLSKASVGGGSLANFTNYYNLISGLRTQWQIENAGSAADWDYDADNTLIIDNFKLERLYPLASEGPRIEAARSGNDLVLTWAPPSTGTVQLQQAANIDGPFVDVPEAASGYTTPMTGNARFFRLVQRP